MLIHKEGHQILIGLGLVLIALNILFAWLFPEATAYVAAVSAILFMLVLQFFRNPKRVIQIADDRIVYAPADGKIVVIERTEELEYFKDKRLMISIFMSPVNVHVNRNPISGIVNYFKYHPGKYLVAWHPKSSLENERTTIVIRNGEHEILLRQIAGTVAKRIKTYLQEGDHVSQGTELGFIKFGSRVDVYLPPNTAVEVVLGQKVKGNQTVLARL